MCTSPSSLAPPGAHLPVQWGPGPSGVQTGQRTKVTEVKHHTSPSRACRVSTAINPDDQRDSEAGLRRTGAIMCFMVTLERRRSLASLTTEARGGRSSSPRAVPVPPAPTLHPRTLRPLWSLLAVTKTPCSSDPHLQRQRVSLAHPPGRQSIHVFIDLQPSVSSYDGTERFR